MSDNYSRLLDAAIEHLEDLRGHGVRYVSVAPDTLKALATPQPSGNSMSLTNRPSARSSAPAPAPAVVPTRASKPPVASSTSASPASVPSRSVAPSPSPLQKGAAPAPTTPLAVPARPLSRQAKEAAMDALRARVTVCVQCAHLAGSRTNVVFGVGDIHSALMFVGEAPGADEDIQGEPFVGAAGQLLTKIIQAMGQARSTVYIANILKCRPDTPGQTSGNRKPTSPEMATCLPYLSEQIDLIQPKVIVALGATAIEGLLGKSEGISKLRGHWQSFRGTPLMPTYHPAYLLRNQALSEKRKVWEDMLKVMEKLDLPISEKQRNFFLRA